MVVIAICGQVASGKSTIAKRIAEKFGLRYISAGSVVRKLAKEFGKDLISFHRILEERLDLDKQIDRIIEEEIKKGNVVVDSHLAAWLFRDKIDIKIYVKADISIRAKRLSKRDNKTYEEALKEIIEREESNKRRFKKLYGVDITDLSIFDLVLDTTYLTIDEELEIVESFIRYVLEKKR